MKLESEVWLSDHISIGVVTETYPPELADAVVASTAGPSSATGCCRPGRRLLRKSRQR